MAPTLADYVTDTRFEQGKQKMFWTGELRFPYIDTSSGYFVDSRAGSTQGDGSLGSPFLTLQQAIAAINASTSTSRKNLYLRCGGLWREDLKQAAFKDNATITSYGTEPANGNCTAKPVISGADITKNVSTDADGFANIPVANAAQVRRVTVGQQAIPLVEWPSQAASSPSNYAIAVGGSRSTLQMGSDAPTSDLVGATISIRTRAYRMATVTVTGQNGRLLTFDPLSPEQGVVASGAGYVLQNAQVLLKKDVPGFFGSGSNLRIATGKPNQIVDVEYSRRDSPIILGQRQDLQIRNIKVKGGQGPGIVLSASPNALLDSVESSGNAEVGVSIPGSNNVTIQNSVFDDNWYVGIDTSNATGAIVQGNTVTRTGTTTPTSPKLMQQAAIRAGTGAIVRRNSIDGVTLSGILINPAVPATVDGNVIKNYCIRFSDCGAIYSANAGKAAAQSATDRAVIKNNMVGAGVANLQGAIGGGIAIVAGIYMDDFTTQIDIINNTLFGMPVGVYLHNSSQVKATGNKIWQTTNVGVIASMDVKDGMDYLAGTVVSANQIVPLNSVTAGTGALPQFGLAKAYLYTNAKRGVSGLNDVFLDNTIVALNGVETGLFADVGVVDANGDINMQAASASEWSAYGSTDRLSPALITRPLYTTQDLTPLPAFSDAFEGPATTKWVYSGTPGGSADFSSTGCEGAGKCLTMVVGTQFDKVENPWDSAFPLDGNGDVYLASFTARVSAQNPPVGPAVVINPYFRERGDTTGTALVTRDVIVSDRMMRGAPGALIKYQSLFQTLRGSNAVFLGLKLNSAWTPVTIDNVLVKKVRVTRQPVQEWAAVAAAPLGASPTVVDCSVFAGSSGTACSAVDLAGQPVAMPTLIPAGTARLLLKQQ